MLLPLRLMLLPFVLIIVMADVFAMYKIVADVITTEADVIAFLFMVLADVIANLMYVVAGVMATKGV